MSKAKQAAVIGTLEIFTASINVGAYYGVTMLEETDHTYRLRIKKPRSSKFYEQIVPKSQALAVYGNVGEEGATTALIRETGVALFSVTGTIAEAEDGTILVTDTNGYVARIKPSADISIQITAADSQAPAPAEKDAAPVPPAA